MATSPRTDRTSSTHGALRCPTGELSPADRRAMAVPARAQISSVPAAAALCGLLMALTACNQPPRSPATQFKLTEATVASIHAAFSSGQITCTQLVQMYLDRISAYDAKGPTLNAIITVNPKALELAAEMDRNYKTNPSS